MSAEPLPDPSASASPLGDLPQLYRRICLLRVAQRTSEARQLEASALPQALATAHAACGEARIADFMAAEEAKVADARMLAELLAPLLATELNLSFTPSPAAVPALQRPAPSPPHSEPLSIADFIDGMIAQEQPARTSPSTASTSSRPQPTIPRSP